MKLLGTLVDAGQEGSRHCQEGGVGSAGENRTYFFKVTHMKLIGKREDVSQEGSRHCQEGGSTEG